MPLTIILAATLRQYVPAYNAAIGYQLEIAEGVSVRDVARRLPIPVEEVKLIMVNGIHADWDTVLKGDERVAFFPPVGGG